MSELSRRAFFTTGAVGAAWLTLKSVDGSTAKAFVNADFIKPVDVPAGQLIDDIVIGSIGKPADRQYHIEFYRASKPDVPVFQVALNTRATFRWVPPPDEEVRLAPGDTLKWRVTEFLDRDEHEDWQIAVHTRGRCLTTRRVIVNQTEFV